MAFFLMSLTILFIQVHYFCFNLSLAFYFRCIYACITKENFYFIFLDNYESFAGWKAQIGGWGKVPGFPVKEAPNFADLELISHNECIERSDLHDFSEYDFLCSHHHGRHVTKGDSGGKFVIQALLELLFK